MQEKTQQKNHQSNYVLTFVAFIAIFLIIGLIYFFGIDSLLLYLFTVGGLLVITCLFAVIIWLCRDWIFQKIFGIARTELGDIQNTLKNLASQLASKDTQKWQNISLIVKNLGLMLVQWYVNTRIHIWIFYAIYTLLGLFIGGLGTYLVYLQNQLLVQQNSMIKAQTQLLSEQNRLFNTQNGLLQIQNRLIENQERTALSQTKLLKEQNDLLINQNIHISQQSYLMEAERRSTYATLIMQIIEKLKVNQTSKELIQQVAALSKAMTPYLFLKTNGLSPRPYSLERGLLLVALLEINLDTSTLQEIYKYSDFSHAYLESVNLHSKYLVGAKLDQAILDNSQIINTNMNNSLLFKTSFKKANISNSKFQRAQLMNTLFDNAQINNSVFKYARLQHSNIGKANKYNCNFEFAFIDYETYNHFSSYKKIDTILTTGKCLMLTN